MAIIGIILTIISVGFGAVYGAVYIQSLNKKWAVLWFSLSCIGFFLGIFLASLGAMHGYSDGSRTGLVQKFSNKGFIWKTNEGEMMLGGMVESGKGIAPNTWQFTCMDPELVGLIKLAQKTGKRTTIHYSEYLIKPVWLGTSYLVTKVEIHE